MNIFRWIRSSIGVSTFLKIYLVLLLIAVLLLFIIGNHPFSERINICNYKYLDLFFKYLTHIGDGLFALIIVGFLFVLRLDLGMHAVTSFSISALITQFIKRICFSDTVRPSVVFSDLIEQGKWHIVEGVDLHELFSFPSGHTTSIFSICILFVFIKPTKSWAVISLLIALLVGFSRIYLSQHFLLDVIVGSVVGTLITVCVIYLLDPVFSKWNKYSIINRFATSD